MTTSYEEPLDPADHSTLILPQEKWDEFVAMLDAPAKDMPKLRALLVRCHRIVRD